MRLIYFLYAILFILIYVLVNKEVNNTNADFYKEIKFWKYNQAIIVYDDQVKGLKKLKYSTWEIIDLLTLKAMECNSYKGDCIWLYNPDIGGFQINSIHKKEYKKSRELFNKKKWWELFIYQAKFAKSLVDSYKKWNCSEKSFKKVKKVFNDEEQFKCIAVSYNWSKTKKAYAKLAFIKRKYVKEYITNLK